MEGVEEAEDDYSIEYGVDARPHVKVAWFDKCNNQGHLSLQQL